ncbi:Site-specific DNA methylase [Candidatus Phaeomarinobacter ectocarpi]|uniref:site-specific DNA-methyltransferase (adenine-specific) n=1 Tax=Candidatus Phaeomarinibacter ectocarpi TaxID=1458461 RepID=X5MGW0_9HYPH|nr:DNA adenine methylase [Candidatus Phaeomarinobacter ectocarpi]CDO60799.1 Site-specific DNA methylase [Candidatus Phaeomarinobacter ectocarpi]
MESIHERVPVRPAHPAAPYIGGKKNLAKRLVKRIEMIPHSLYAEPFVGMGGVFLKRLTRPRAEVINDISKDVATFFRILQRHYVPFVEMMRFQLTTRVEFERLMATDPDTLTDLERAARFLYLQRTAFGGRVAGRHFGVSPDRPARFDVTKLVPVLEDLHVRLAGVVIERLAWDAFIDRYDRPNALFYLDPPYWGAERDYGDQFTKADFERLAVQLAELKGTFLLSINDRPEVRKIFDGFKMEKVKVARTAGVNAKARKAVSELIIS